MNGKIYDSHAHYDSEAFDEDRDEVLSGLAGKGVCGVVNCGSDLPTSQKSLELAEKYDFVYAACGVHPHEALGAPGDYLARVKEMLAHPKCVAIGEIGLDYHYDFSPRELQLKVFEEQIILANELNMPVIIHDREAHEDTFRILRKHKPKGVVHCFSGSAELAAEAVKLGLYIGLGGAATFKNARKPLEVAASVPLDRLLIETDCPYMTPVPFRGQRNDSSLIAYSAEVIAEAAGVTPDELLNITRQNANTLFGTEL